MGFSNEGIRESKTARNKKYGGVEEKGRVEK